MSGIVELRRNRRAPKVVIGSFVLASFAILVLGVDPAAASSGLPPSSAVLSRPAVRTGSTTTTFHVTSTQPVFRLLCSLDGATSVPCPFRAVSHTSPPQWNIIYHLSVGRDCLSTSFAENVHPRTGPTTRCWTIVGTGSSLTLRHLSGTPQSALVSTPFGSPLVALVVDSHFHAVRGVRVIFTAPSTGASSRFAHCQGGNPRANSCVAVTNASGVATTSKLTANGTSGSYAVIASAPNVDGSASFSLMNSAAFTISGSIRKPLFPGGSQSIDLVLTNPNSTPITIDPGAITTTITSIRSACTASRNFAVAQGLESRVTVPARSTMSLAGLGISKANWPVVAMVETNSNQDACEGDHLVLHYSGIARAEDVRSRA